MVTYLTYDSIGKQEGRIRDLINEPRTQYSRIKQKGLWQQLCSCLDVIGDTEIAIAAYNAKKMDSGKGSLYLAVYGLLQSFVLQQDAVFHLGETLDIKGIRSKYPRLEQIREIRNDSIGHPTKRDRTKKGKKLQTPIMVSHVSLSVTRDFNYLQAMKQELINLIGSRYRISWLTKTKIFPLHSRIR